MRDPAGNYPKSSHCQDTKRDLHFIYSHTIPH